MTKTQTEPLKITAKMADGRLCSADGWIFLDAILYHAWFMKHHPKIFDGTLKNDIDIGHIGLPLRQLDNHRYAASVGFYKQYGLQTEHWNKRPSAHGRLGQKYIDFGKRRGKLNASSGPYKSYRMPEVIRLVGEITFYAYGTKSKIEELLSYMTHLGKKTSIGWGKVKEWIVESIEEDFTTICPHGLARPIEIDKADDEVKKHAHTIQDIAVRPAYWDYKNVETCFVPNPILGDNDGKA